MKFQLCMAPGIKQPALINEEALTRDLSQDGSKGRQRHSVVRG